MCIYVFFGFMNWINIFMFKKRGAESIEHLQKGRNKVKTRKFNYIDVTPKKINKKKNCKQNYGKIL